VEALGIMKREKMSGRTRSQSGEESRMSNTGTFSAIPTKIVVPIDFSPSSHAALEAATELAEKFHAQLYLLHVIPEFPVVALPETVSEGLIVEAAKKAAAEHFEVSMAGLAAKKVKATTNVEVGNDVAGSILEAIERENADLVVITTHGLSGWYPQVFGSIAEKLVKLVQCPLLLLRTPKPESSAKVTTGRMMEWW
jgi:nucleotide-binding universal stress UspA family protein